MIPNVFYLKTVQTYKSINKIDIYYKFTNNNNDTFLLKFDSNNNTFN